MYRRRPLQTEDLLKKSARPVVIVLLCLSLFSPIYAEPPSARPVAEWIKSAVVYELNVRTFSATSNFRGAEQGLDRLKDLGVTIVWLMPINPLGQAKKKGTIGSPYAVQDYYSINPAYGAKEDLNRFVAAAHQRGLKVIVDVVPNHTAWDSVLIKQHPEWFKKDAQGNIIPPVPDWADVAGLDYRNPQLRAYMTEMLKYWLREFNLDGLRVDVAHQVPADFWNDVAPELRKTKSDIVLIAEANQPELLVKAFDIDYAWPFHSMLTEVFEFGRPATALVENWERERDRYPKGAIEMRFSDNHDEKRAIARFGEMGTLAASALVFTMDGVPMLYNGMEAGDTTESGAPALFENMPVFWPISDRRPLYPTFYKDIIALRKANPALQQGETEWLRNSDVNRVLTYVRRHGGEQFLVAINVSNQPFTGVVAAPAGEYEDVTPGFPKKSITLPALALNGWEFRILRKIR